MNVRGTILIGSRRSAMRHIRLMREFLSLW